MKILVVEDNNILCKALVNKLIRAGYDVEIAADGLEGWEKINSSQPDLALVDIMMPKLSGFELLQKLRENNSSVKVALITNLDDPATQQRAEEFQVQLLVKADHSINEMASFVNEMLNG